MATITDNDLALFRERAKTELESTGDIGRIAWDCVVEELCKEVARLRSGDCAKLREALEFCVKGMCGFCRMDAEARGMTTECVNGCEALRKAKAALAEIGKPRRNCDVGTAEEQSERMDAAYCSKRLCAKGKCPLFKPGLDCSLIWAQMPYAEQEGGSK